MLIPRTLRTAEAALWKAKCSPGNSTARIHRACANLGSATGFGDAVDKFMPSRQPSGSTPNLRSNYD